MELQSGPPGSDARVKELEDKIRHIEHKLSSIQEIGTALGSTLNLDKLLELIMTKVTELMNADRSTLYLLEEEQGELWSKIAQEYETREIRLKVGSGIAGWVAQTGQTVNIKDAYKDPRFNQEFDRKSGYRTRSILCQPMRNYQRKIIGVIQVLNKKDGYFSIEDEQLLSALTSHAAVSIENSKLYLSVVGKNIELLDAQEKLRQKIKILDALYLIEKEITQADREEQLLDAIIKRSLEIVPSEAGTLWLFDEKHPPHIHLQIADRETQRVDGTRENGLTALIGESGEARLQNDVGEQLGQLEPFRRFCGLSTRNFVAVPLIVDDALIGSLELHNKRRGENYTDEDLHVITVLAGQTARAILQKREQDKKQKEGRLATIGQMLSGVLHDFKTPMSIISGYVQLMARESDEDMRGEYMSAILKQFDHLSNMTKELLAFARGESNILIRKVFLNKFIDDMTELLGQEFREHSVDLIVQANYRGSIRMDENKIKRVFYNIARNAREAMTEGGTFRIVIDRVDDFAVFSFKDTGKGIPQEIRDRL
ncbi:MAG: GAF domain-containing sensor histidine kinase, partial [Myxococcales bacterium]|nr:GAF domain-containing sensor histidine kinase [Myxococcales bacterium]